MPMQAIAEKQKRSRYIRYFLFLSLAPVFFVTLAISGARLLQAAKGVPMCDAVNAAGSLVWLAFSVRSFVRLSQLRAVHSVGRRRIATCRNENQQAFTFFLATIIPMVSLGALGEVAGSLCFWVTVFMALPLLFRTRSCLMNPVLVGLGFNLYGITFAGDNAEYVFVTRRQLHADDDVYPIEICAPFFFEGQQWQEGAA